VKHIYILILFFIISGSSINGQDKNQLIIGKVSFVTSKNVYVKFVDTKDINPGDSLKFMNQLKPCLLVKSKSSSSVVCTIIADCEVNKGDDVYYGYVMEETDSNDVTEINDSEIDSSKITVVKEKESKKESQIRGRLSLAGYGNLSNIRDDRYGIMSSFSLSAEHIKDSKFSFYSYLNYRQNFIADDINYTRKTTFFNVYDLAVKYDIDPTLSVVLGRKINPQMSSIGAIDGLQAEKYFNRNYVGVIVGFRPDIFDFSFNPDLFQYGAYYGRLSDRKNFRSETTIGFIEQRNVGEIDRRYAYFQHSSTIGSKLNLFGSAELDFYSKVNDTVSNDLRLTNLYVSARYRFSRKVNLMVSYDSRKRILYYETFQSAIEKLLDEDLARQGLRFRLNIRPVKHLNAGFGYSKRFQSDNENKSDNIQAYATYSKIPGIDGSLTVNYNMNTSNYLKSNILSFRYSRHLIENKLYADLSYRLAKFDYFNSFTSSYDQNYYGLNLSLNITRKLYFSVYGEMATTKAEDNYRIFTKLIKRF
jgi:hypothetical protein